MRLSCFIIPEVSPGFLRHRVPVAAARSGWFTLMELILVMALVAVVMTVTVPFLRGFLGARESAQSAARILALTRIARDRAIAEGDQYRMNFDLAEGRFWLTRQVRGELDLWSAGTGLESQAGLRLPDGIEVWLDYPGELEELGWIPFYPDGRTEMFSFGLGGTDGQVWRLICPAPGEDVRVVRDHNLMVK